jgi:hypothetical protein
MTIKNNGIARHHVPNYSYLGSRGRGYDQSSGVQEQPEYIVSLHQKKENQE